MKKFSIILCSALAVCSLAMFSCQRDTDDEEEEKGGNQVANVEIKASSSNQMAKNVAIGWNLGNTLDATGAKDLTSETSWGQPMTTKAMIDGIAAAGFKTIRLPVSWHNHITDTSSYTIDTAWISRVKEVVDWSLEAGLYVILNTHHDNAANASEVTAGSALYHPTKDAYSESSKFLKAVWTQICATFNNSYNEKLIFEVLNEPRLTGTSYEWWFNPNDKICQEGAEYLLKLEQDCLDVIRASGGNNASRYVMIPSLSANPDAALSDYFKLPNDSTNDRLIVSVHSYRPYAFAMYDSNNPDKTTFDSADEAALKSDFEKLYTKFVSKGIGVIIGETSATNKGNLAEREKWAKYFFGTAYAYGMPSVFWDNAVYEAKVDDGERHGYYNRTAQTWYFPTIIKEAMSAVGVTAGTLTQSN